MEVVKDPYYLINREMINQVPFHIHCNTEEEYKICCEHAQIFLDERTPFALGRVFDSPLYGIGIYRSENANKYSIWLRKW